MCFGNKKRQGDCHPQNNNYCGGFALDAVLTDGNSKDPNPIATYENIRGVQNEKMITDSSSDKFIEARTENDTVMLLPSSIAIAAEREGLEAKVYYDSSVKSSFGDIMDEELEKLANMAVEIKTNDDGFWNEVNLEAADSNYFIVLVVDRHWVAVKKIDENNFICYDPDNGSCTGEEANILEAIRSADYTNINSLVIALKKK